MKISKNIKIKLFVLVAFLVLMFVQIGPYLLYADENELTFSYKRIALVATNEYYNSRNLFFSEAYVGQNIAYCLDYGIPVPTENGGTVKYLRQLSNITTAGLVYGYPNVSASDLGVNNDEEARYATQLAIWRLSQATGVNDSQKTNYILDMNNLTPTAGYEDYIERVKAAAQRIIDRAIADPYYANPTLNIIGESSKIQLLDNNKMLVGPFKIDGRGYNVTSVSVRLENQPASAQLCDASGNVKDTFANQEDVYIILDQNVGAVSFNLVVDEKGSHNVGKVYGTGNSSDGKQDYCFLTTLPDALTAIMDINLPELTGGIKVLKTDQYSQPLEGVTFELRDENGKVLQTKETDANGVIEFTNLKIGKYIVAETKALEGYIMMNIPVEVEVSYNTVRELNIKNRKIEGGLKIVKVGEDKTTPIAGVTFEILDENKNVIDTITTNSEGAAISNKLEIGTYYFKEVSAVPEAHVVIDSTERKFEITEPNVIKVYTVMNYYTRGKLTVHKINEDGNPIAGVVFDILDADKNVVDTITTDENGNATTNKFLKKGTYYYQEKSAPQEAKVVVNTDLQEFTMEYEDRTIEVKNNYARGQLKIIKTGDDGSKLKDVTFNILDENKNIVDTITTDENGIAISKELVIGKYYYKEVIAKDPRVIIDENEYEFILSQNNQILEAQVENELIKMAQLKIVKTGDDGSKLKDVTFNILDANKNIVDTITTDEDGIAISKQLVLGKYYYKEISAKDSRVIIDESEYEFILSQNNQVLEVPVENEIIKMAQLKIIKTADDGSKLANISFNILNENKEVVDTITTDEDGIAISKELLLGKYYYKELPSENKAIIVDENEYEFILAQNNQVLEIPVENELKRGSLSIYKVDEDGNYLENVTFTLLDEEGNEVGKQTTGKDGLAKFENLLPGKYNFKEVDAPIFVVADKEEKPVEITVDELNIEVTVKNNFAKGILKIHKTDMADNDLSGVTFEILDSDKNVIDTKTTDENGMLESIKLPIGKYYYREVSAEDENIIIKTELVSFVIAENEQVVLEEVKNETIDGVVIITKVDADNRNVVLAGAEIQILDANKNVIGTLTTDENGQVKLGNLKIGKYYYKETKAPEGYILDSNEYEFNITKDAQVKEITFKNEAKKLPQTGGFISTNMLIVIIVAVVSIVGYITITLITKNKQNE